MSVADRIAIIAYIGPKMIEEGTPQEIYNKPKKQFIFEVEFLGRMFKKIS